MRRAKAFVVLLFTLAGSARLASADPDDERKADTLFNEAKALVLAGKYADACPKLEESQRLDPALGTEFNLADCDEHLGRTATAWRLFVDVEHAARAAGKKEREDKARERASALEPTLSKLRLHGVVAGATVTRDGEAIPAGELDGYALDPGAHVIQVSEPDKKPWQTTVRGAARGMIDVTVPPLEPLIATPATASTGAPIPSQTATTPPGSSGLGTQKVLALVAGGLGVVGVGLGVGFGFASMGKHNDASKVCAVPNPCNDPTAAQAWTDATSAGNVSTVAFIVGGVLLAGGVVLWLLAPHSRESGEGAAQRPRLEVAPQIGAGFYGLGMRGGVLKRAALVCVVLLPLAWAGCNAILGNDDGVYVPGGSDASNGDAPMQGDHTAPPDAPARDAPANVDAGGDAMTTADSGGDGDAATTPDAGDGSSSDAGEDADGAGPSDASTCDANFGTDPDNCGECGRVCGADAGCHSGLCDPIVVVGGLNGPSAISADTSGVYFSTTGTSSGGDAYATEGVFSCPSSGCAGGPATLAIDQKSPVAIALGPSTVYWLNADANDLVSCAKTGCSGLPVELTAQAGSYLTSLTIGAGTLYWTDGVGNVVSSCSTSGTCATPTQVAKLNASTSPGPISFLGATVFFANNVTGAGSVMSCAGSGCGTSPMTLVPSVASPLAVFADVSGVYFTSAASGLERVSLDGGEIGDGGSLLNGLFYPSGLVVDGRYAFVADSAGGSVWRVTLDGSSIPVAIATSQNSPTQVAVDATWVYWTNSGSTRTNGSVMKAAK